MQPNVIWPDVEAFLIGYLSSALSARTEPHAQGVSVRRNVPSEIADDSWPSSKRLVTVRDDGGPVLGDVRAVARMGINVWAASEEESSDLANLVVALVASADNQGPVRRVDVSRAYAIPEDSGRSRRYFTAELVVRGDPLTS